MKTKLLFVSVAAALLLTGCNEADETEAGLEEQFKEASPGPVDAAYASKLAGSIVDAIEADETANEVSGTPDTSSLAPAAPVAASAAYSEGIAHGEHACQESGSVRLDEISVKNSPPTLSVDATFNDCANGFVVQNGSVRFLFTKEEQTFTASERFTTDFTRTGGVHDFVFFKESEWTFTAVEGETHFDALKNYVITVDGRKWGAEAWRHRHLTTPQRGWYPVSGKVYVDNLERYYTVDPDYDASQTPFLLNGEGLVESGQSQYVGADNGKYRIKVETAGYFTLHIDSDGDGDFDDGNVTLPQR